MDFSLSYTQEQEKFRKEVRAWLDETVPKDLENPPDSIDLGYEQYMKRRDIGRRLGEKGWLWPTAPREYGGGGLTMDHSVVIEEELDEFELNLPPYYDSGGRLGASTIMVWGNEEQKRHFLLPIFKGEVRTWQLITEPGAGSDLAGVQTTAIRDGDDYVINGQKIFVGSSHGADQFWMITVTDPNAPRHENLGWFMLPADSPGITITPMDLLNAGGEGGAGTGVKNTVYFDNVRVPAFNLVGRENNGWKVASTHLELEHGAGGTITRNRLVERLFNYCKETLRNGKPLSKDPDVQDLLVDIFIDTEISRLFGLRNYWMRHAKEELRHEGPQSSFHRKTAGLRIAKAILQIMGPYALTNDPKWDPLDGQIEVHQRSSIVCPPPWGHSGNSEGHHGPPAGHWSGYPRAGRDFSLGSLASSGGQHGPVVD